LMTINVSLLSAPAFLSFFPVSFLSDPASTMFPPGLRRTIKDSLIMINEYVLASPAVRESLMTINVSLLSAPAFLSFFPVSFLSDPASSAAVLLHCSLLNSKSLTPARMHSNSVYAKSDAGYSVTVMSSDWAATGYLCDHNPS
jgi:hypothetical protein